MTTTPLRQIPLVNLSAQQAEISEELFPRIQEILSRGNFIGGEDVAAFEAEYASYLSVKHCVGVGNGTDALEMALLASGVGPGDEVIVPANTFIATVEAVVRAGATPVLTDVDETHLLMTPSGVEETLTPRTAAVIPVHLFGQVAPVESIMEVVEGRSITVLEDAAQAQGAKRNGLPAGALGDISATSFYPGKNLGAAGDAGAVMTNNHELAHQVRLLGAHGSEKKYEHEVMGRNSRLDTIQAAVLRAKLRRLDGWNAQRRTAAERYAEMLGDIAGVTLPESDSANDDVWHLYVVRVDNRERISKELNESGIATGIHYPVPNHRTAAWEKMGLPMGVFPVAEAAAGRILSLPLYPHITEDDQWRVASALRIAVQGKAGASICV